MIELAGLDALQERLGYRFADSALLSRALIHRSLVNETALADVDSNERLEFLGDAALGLVVTEFLYERFPQKLEGDLSVLRAALVNLDSLAECAEALNLGAYIVTGGGEILTGRRSVLGRCYEALLGAVFLDGGLGVVGGLLTPWLERFAANPDAVSQATDDKSQLQKHVQRSLGNTPSYRLLWSTGPDHDRRFGVEVLVGGRSLGQGEGTSVQRAEQAAAGCALDVLRREAGPGDASPEEA